MKRALISACVLLALASPALAVPHSQRKAQRYSQYQSSYRAQQIDPWQVWRANRAYSARQYGQQGGAGWNQQYLPNVPRPYYQTLPGWSVMPSLPDAPNYGAGNGWSSW